MTSRNSTGTLIGLDRFVSYEWRKYTLLRQRDITQYISGLNGFAHYDFLLVFAKKVVNFLSTWSLLQWGHLIFGWDSYSLIERYTVNSFLQSLHIYSYAGIALPPCFMSFYYSLYHSGKGYNRYFAGKAARSSRGQKGTIRVARCEF